jgi:hypothetical protein
VTSVLAPALAIILVGFGVQRASATSLQRAPFQGPQAERARETLRQALEPRSVVITSEDMGRPAENIEYYGGVPRSTRPTSNAGTSGRPTPRSGSSWRAFDLSAGRQGRARARTDTRRPGLEGAQGRARRDIPSGRNMEYFVASPARRDVNSELFRISHPRMEELRRLAGPKPGG